MKKEKYRFKIGIIYSCFCYLSVILTKSKWNFLCLLLIVLLNHISAFISLHTWNNNNKKLQVSFIICLGAWTACLNYFRLQVQYQKSWLGLTADLWGEWILIFVKVITASSEVFRKVTYALYLFLSGEINQLWGKQSCKSLCWRTV